MSVALRTWMRYLVPLTLLGAIACAPLLYVAWTAKAPATVQAARMQVRFAWGLGGAALVFQLLAVAAVAPAVRAVASGAPLSQLRVLAYGARNLLRGLLPWVIVTSAIVLGGIALVVPGVLLACLLSLTGASDQLARPKAAIADSLAVARAQLPRLALIVGAIVALDLAITLAAQLHYVPMITKKAAAAKLAPIRSFIQATGVGLAAITALPACVLAAVYSRSKR